MSLLACKASMEQLESCVPLADFDCKLCDLPRPFIKHMVRDSNAQLAILDPWDNHPLAVGCMFCMQGLSATSCLVVEVLSTGYRTWWPMPLAVRLNTTTTTTTTDDEDGNPPARLITAEVDGVIQSLLWRSGISMALTTCFDAVSTWTAAIIWCPVTTPPQFATLYCAHCRTLKLIL